MSFSLGTIQTCLWWQALLCLCILVEEVTRPSQKEFTAVMQPEFSYGGGSLNGDALTPWATSASTHSSIPLEYRKSP